MVIRPESTGCFSRVTVLFNSVESNQIANKRRVCCREYSMLTVVILIKGLFLILCPVISSHNRDAIYSSNLTGQI